jgi:hypothetical protein
MERFQGRGIFSSGFLHIPSWTDYQALNQPISPPSITRFGIDMVSGGSNQASSHHPNPREQAMYVDTQSHAIFVTGVGKRIDERNRSWWL